MNTDCSAAAYLVHRNLFVGEKYKVMQNRIALQNISFRIDASAEFFC